MTSCESGNGETEAQGGLFALDRTEIFTVKNSAQGDDYRIAIALPEGEVPPGGWPSLYLLDAAGSFGTCVEALRRMDRRTAATGVAPMIVVGISAVSGYDVARRQRDYTTPRAGAEANGTEGGGAARFLDFIEDRVEPAVSARIMLNPARRTLCGHSLGGYFALWAMTERPGSFRACAAISPSIWWDKPGLMARVERLADSDLRMLIAFGEWEDALPPWQRDAPDSESVLARRRARGMISGGTEVAARLANLLGEDRVRLLLLPEEDHASIVSAAMPRALRLASQA